jgi:hypothetical protein
MFFSHIDHLERKRSALPKAVVKGLEYLKSTDFSRIAPTRSRASKSPQLQTVSRTERRIEAHLKAGHSV